MLLAVSRTRVEDGLVVSEPKESEVDLVALLGALEARLRDCVHSADEGVAARTGAALAALALCASGHSARRGRSCAPPMSFYPGVALGGRPPHNNRGHRAAAKLGRAAPERIDGACQREPCWRVGA